MTISEPASALWHPGRSGREHPTGRTHALDSSHNPLFVGTTTLQQALETIDVLAWE